MDPKRKFFLLKQSKNFCAAPWTNLYLEANGDILTCCVGRTVLGNIRNTSLSEILNGSVANEIRNTLIKDEFHNNCVVCQEFNSEYDPWLRGHYNDLPKSLDINYDSSEFTLAGVDLRWSNTCNFKCVYCEPKYSNGIERELNVTFSNGDHGNQAVLDFVLANQNNIKEIYLAGGEPMLMKENRQFLEQFTNFNTKLRINTNLSNINEKNNILTMIKKFKDVLWTVSVENIEDRYEYTRYGGNWQQFIKNLEVIKNLNHSIRFNLVYFIGNALTFADDFNFLKKLIPQCDFSVVPVIGHEAISSRNLPNDLKDRAKSELKSLLDEVAIPLSLCNNVSNCIKELEKESNGLDYKKYFDSLDAKRGTNWKIIFPELV
jgi:hypothetical protein